MDLKEYIGIFRKNFKLFAFVIVLTLATGIIFQVIRPTSYRISLELNITRAGTQETSEYKFDSFYRLQADERFADTIVRWLGTPRIATDIYDEVEIETAQLSERQLSKIFKAQRLSSQMIHVTYVAQDISTAKKLSTALTNILNRKTEELDNLQKEDSWFKILASKPLIKENKPNLMQTALVFLAFGIFLGTWVVFIRHYWK